ncbi:hypothetical protein PCANC_15638 [Puccinia coronata f. sp. avenae]|uniref:Uncharacterized protein n=1 Tax=Puccinia coronata f. sp. avenae TaxID=200324 RepID=A0A2N5UP75_9BASI|nr:hypothetical protein PCANC_15638 [Puccinia coronata f. sp. avenae]
MKGQSGNLDAIFTPDWILHRFRQRLFDSGLFPLCIPGSEAHSVVETYNHAPVYLRRAYPELKALLGWLSAGSFVKSCSLRFASLTLGIPTRPPRLKFMFSSAVSIEITLQRQGSAAGL